jgi:hypothetical protein
MKISTFINAHKILVILVVADLKVWSTTHQHSGS